MGRARKDNWRETFQEYWSYQYGFPKIAACQKHELQPILELLQQTEFVNLFGSKKPYKNINFSSFNFE